ncbi:MAG: TetR/AcrR family transcriptional regulator, partial [Chloroflexota bacterium]
MPLNPDDPRVIKTRRGFQEAFLRLLVEHGYDAITIKDIAEEALSSRVSFYRHYRDKDDLLIHCLNDLYEKLASQTEVFSPERMEKEGYVPLLRFYEHIEKHEALYEILLTGHGTHIVLNRLREHFARRAIAQINWYCSPEELAAPVEILAYHMSSTQIAMAVWW